MTAGIREMRFQAFSGGSDRWVRLLFVKGEKRMADDYYMRKISMSLEKIERHLSVVSEFFKNLRTEKKDAEDRIKEKEEEE